MRLEAFQGPKAYDEGLLGPLGRVVTGMEYRGVPIDPDRARALAADFHLRVAKTRGELEVWAEEIHWTGKEFPPNWNSHDQLVAVLHDAAYLGLQPSPFRKKGAVDVARGERSTDDRALEWLSGKYPHERPHLDLIRRLRKEERMERYLLDWLDKAVFHADDGTWRLHPSFGLATDFDDRPGAGTGRFAIKNPPLQQVPSHGPLAKLLREVFVAPPGKVFVASDFSALEVVLLAHLCHRLFGATGLVNRLRPGAPDIHSSTADFVFREFLGQPEAKGYRIEDYKTDGHPATEKRDKVKAVRYGLNYGKGAYGFGTTLFTPAGDPLGEDASQRLIDALMAFDPELKLYQDFIRAFIREHGAIVSLLGRVMHLPDANARIPRLANRAWRQALNYPMQAGGQEITAVAMIEAAVDEVLVDLGFEMVLQVHDEIVGLVDEDVAEKATRRLEEVMVRALPLDAHLGAKAKYGKRLSDTK